MVMVIVMVMVMVKVMVAPSITGLFLLRCWNVDCLQSREVILLEDIDEQ